MNEKQALKILVAEDERPMARALELKLSKAGYQVKLAFDGEEALQALDREKFDLLLLDLMMPKKDGFVVLVAIREKAIGLPVIVSTNLSQEEDIAKAKELGADDYFVKSNTPISKVVEYIDKLLAKK
jgi:DNA-binding response OmpR family regulator